MDDAPSVLHSACLYVWIMEETLILSVFNHPAVWNVHMQHYHGKNRSNIKWQEIRNKMLACLVRCMFREIVNLKDVWTAGHMPSDGILHQTDKSDWLITNS